MPLFLSQVVLPDGSRAVVMRDDGGPRLVPGAGSTRELAHDAILAGRSLADELAARDGGAAFDLQAALAEGRVLLPLDHTDPAHLFMTGTGLTHLGSASARDAMHQNYDPDNMTDSMKMFRMGLEGGKPRADEIGVQPEWFYKGNGNTAVAPGQALNSPSFALDAGEEPEIAGLYLIAPDGRPFRVGFALSNEFSDHITERGNYLWLAHSKLRQASYGPEMLIGDLPAHIDGNSRIIRNDKTIWEKPFLSGEANMSHSLANLEYHHFKYDLFRQPGDVHVHFFGTATLSFADGIAVQPDDVFEISSGAFGLPLRNPLQVQARRDDSVAVGKL